MVEMMDTMHVNVVDLQIVVVILRLTGVKVQRMALMILVTQTMVKMIGEVERSIETIGNDLLQVGIRVRINSYLPIAYQNLLDMTILCLKVRSKVNKQF